MQDQKQDRPKSRTWFEAPARMDTEWRETAAFRPARPDADLRISTLDTGWLKTATRPRDKSARHRRLPWQNSSMANAQARAGNGGHGEELSSGSLRAAPIGEGRTERAARSRRTSARRRKANANTPAGLQPARAVGSLLPDGEARLKREDTRSTAVALVSTTHGIQVPERRGGVAGGKNMTVMPNFASRADARDFATYLSSLGGRRWGPKTLQDSDKKLAPTA